MKNNYKSINIISGIIIFFYIMIPLIIENFFYNNYYNFLDSKVFYLANAINIIPKMILVSAFSKVIFYIVALLVLWLTLSFIMKKVNSLIKKTMENQ